MLRTEDERYLADELARVEAQLAPTDQFDAVLAALEEILGLVAGSMNDAACERWLEVALKTLAAEPTEALAIGFHRALRECRFANEVVPFIVARCEEWKGPLRRHLQHLRTIATAANVN